MYYLFKLLDVATVGILFLIFTKFEQFTRDINQRLQRVEDHLARLSAGSTEMEGQLADATAFKAIPDGNIEAPEDDSNLAGPSKEISRDHEPAFETEMDDLSADHSHELPIPPQNESQKDLVDEDNPNSESSVNGKIENQIKKKKPLFGKSWLSNILFGAIVIVFIVLFAALMLSDF